MSFKPVYADNNPAARVCYMMNGKWRVQLHDGSAKSNERDPWQNWSPVLDRDEALRVLSRYRIAAKATA